MTADITRWVAEKLAEDRNVEVVSHTPEGFLVVRSQTGYTFLVAVISVPTLIECTHVAPLFLGAIKPQLVVNVPSRAMWSGDAIHHIHDQGAAFGTFGDIARAADSQAAGEFRNKNMDFFLKSMRQHTNVVGVSYVSESVFRANRRRGDDVTVAVIDAYNMSAEDVRNARDRLGGFDVIVKSSSYGKITTAAQQAAGDMGAEALTFRELMQRLAR